MELLVYKGFNKNFYNTLTTEPLLDTDINSKLNVLSFSSDISDLIQISILMKKGKKYWMTYEEFWCTKDFIEQRLKNNPKSFSLKIIENNIYPQLYPLAYEYDNELLENLVDFEEQDTSDINYTDKEKALIKYYSAIKNINNIYYVSYYNEELFSKDLYKISNKYNKLLEINEYSSKVDYIVDISNDLEKYIEHLQNIENNNYKTLGVIINGNGNIVNKILNSLQIAMKLNHIKHAFWYEEIIKDDNEVDQELISIAKNELKIPNFKSFRNVTFYENPLISNKKVEISQATIIKDIITQGENAINKKTYKDIFITASTGAGKSIIFQIPAIYLAKHYNQLTIIIEPIKELMVDQVDNMKKRGYFKVAYINGDITVEQKDEIIEKVKQSEINILYLSPETLLSYNINSIIGDREIGLLIVDEAHIVTTWGVGFRPDYWFLGNYINNIRKETNNRGVKDKNKKARQFPICTFTATAVVGGLEDTVNDTIISLYMNDPIKYIGDVKRDNIKFIINVDNDKYGKSNYDTKKTEYLYKNLNTWIKNKEKTIVYFPYNKTALQAYNSSGEFTSLSKYQTHTGIYTGQTDIYLRKNSLINFKQNNINVMYATKAFGMGIDIDDIKNVYHFAVSGSLSDYVQEIGRCARQKNSVGYAITDYLQNDMNYMKNLFGMSSIKHFHINSILSILYNIYNAKRSRRFLITPRMFDGVFGKTKDDNELESKLKIALLMLEKDFYDKFQFKVLIARPRSMFSKAFVCVDNEELKFVRSSKYWKYFKRFSPGRNRVLQTNGVLVSDLGDIYKVDLEKMWEELYPNKSFADFKRCFYSPDEDVLEEIKNYVHPRQMLTINKKNIDSFSEIDNKCKEEIDFICAKLNELKGGYFSINDFEKKLQEKYGNTLKAQVISQSFINTIDPNRKSIKTKQAENGETLYYITNGIYRNLTEKILYQSQIYKELIKIADEKYIRFIDKNNDNVSYSLKSLKLLALLDLITYEILGGDNPEIYIFLADPEKIKKIVSRQIFYKNDYVDLAVKKHNSSIKILDFFFRNLNNDTERWNYIEDYFLGENVLEKYNQNFISDIEAKNVIKFINKEQSIKLPSWSKLKYMFIETYQPIIKKLDISKVPTPDFINKQIKVNSSKYVTLIMVWKDKQILIFDEDEDEDIISSCTPDGWNSFKISKLNDINLKQLFKRSKKVKNT